MLFREHFHIRTLEVVPSLQTTGDLAVSIAPHSRHLDPADEGSYIDQEIRCLKRFVSTATGTCVAYLMSDRQQTLNRLAEWLVERNCSAQTASHTQESASKSKPEHGPFAGTGFFTDLESASRARTAVVGDFSRSSTALLLDLIAYDRRIEGHEDNLKLCELPDRLEL
jgi:hypothetical protein